MEPPRERVAEQTLISLSRIQVIRSRYFHKYGILHPYQDRRLSSMHRAPFFCIFEGPHFFPPFLPSNYKKKGNQFLSCPWEDKGIRFSHDI